MAICIKTMIRAEEEDVGVDLREEEVEGVAVTAIAVNRGVVTTIHTTPAHIPEENSTHQEEIT